MAEKRTGPALGVRLIEVSVKRELTVPQSLVILSCCFAEDGKEMYKDL